MLILLFFLINFYMYCFYIIYLLFIIIKVIITNVFHMITIFYRQSVRVTVMFNFLSWCHCIFLYYIFIFICKLIVIKVIITTNYILYSQSNYDFLIFSLVIFLVFFTYYFFIGISVFVCFYCNKSYNYNNFVPFYSNNIFIKFIYNWHNIISIINNNIM